MLGGSRGVHYMIVGDRDAILSICVNVYVVFWKHPLYVSKWVRVFLQCLEYLGALGRALSHPKSLPKCNMRGCLKYVHTTYPKKFYRP